MTKPPRRQARLARGSARRGFAPPGSSEGGAPPSWGFYKGAGPLVRVGKAGFRAEPTREEGILETVCRSTERQARLPSGLSQRRIGGCSRSLRELCGLVLRKNHFSMAELQWPACLRERDPIPQDNRTRHARLARHSESGLASRARRARRVRRARERLTAYFSILLVFCWQDHSIMLL